jgi:hypothetical protein
MLSQLNHKKASDSHAKNCHFFAISLLSVQHKHDHLGTLSTTQTTCSIDTALSFVESNLIENRNTSIAQDALETSIPRFFLSTVVSVGMSLDMFP